MCSWLCVVDYVINHILEGPVTSGWLGLFEKHRKIKEDINNKRFPVRDISVNFRFGFGFGLHFLPTTVVTCTFLVI
jgi:hypothetical protein